MIKDIKLLQTIPLASQQDTIPTSYFKDVVMLGLQILPHTYLFLEQNFV